VGRAHRVEGHHKHQEEAVRALAEAREVEDEAYDESRHAFALISCNKLCRTPHLIQIITQTQTESALLQCRQSLFLFEEITHFLHTSCVDFLELPQSNTHSSVFPFVFLFLFPFLFCSYFQSLVIFIYSPFSRIITH
jgi:hypothetical protein